MRCGADRTGPRPSCSACRSPRSWPGALFAAHAAGSWTYAASTREAQAQQASLHQVPASLLQAALPLSLSGSGSGANARWKAPDGHVCTGQVFVPADAPARSTVTVWVNQARQLTDPPLQHSQITGRMYLSEALAVAALAVALITAGAVARWALDRRRLAAWDAEWAIGRTSVEPPPVTGRGGRGQHGQGVGQPGRATWLIRQCGSVRRKPGDIGAAHAARPFWCAGIRD